MIFGNIQNCGGGDGESLLPEMAEPNMACVAV